MKGGPRSQLAQKWEGSGGECVQLRGSTFDGVTSEGLVRRPLCSGVPAAGVRLAQSWLQKAF